MPREAVYVDARDTRKQVRIVVLWLVAGGSAEDLPSRDAQCNEMSSLFDIRFVDRWERSE
jgi:hypothetical protein